MYLYCFFVSHREFGADSLNLGADLLDLGTAALAPFYLYRVSLFFFRRVATLIYTVHQRLLIAFRVAPSTSFIAVDCRFSIVCALARSPSLLIHSQRERFNLEVYHPAIFNIVVNSILAPFLSLSLKLSVFFGKGRVCRSCFRVPYVTRFRARTRKEVIYRALEVAFFD